MKVYGSVTRVFRTKILILAMNSVMLLDYYQVNSYTEILYYY